MTVEEAAAHLRTMLLDAGFRLDRPDPGLAWEVFKQFLLVPVESAGGRECEEAWFEACEGRQGGGPGYFDFVRQFLQDTDGGAEWHEQITAHFTCPPEARLGIPEGGSVGVDLTKIPASFGAVEASKAFEAGRRYAGWSFEVRIDAC